MRAGEFHCAFHPAKLNTIDQAQQRNQIQNAAAPGGAAAGVFGSFIHLDDVRAGALVGEVHPVSKDMLSALRLDCQPGPQQRSTRLLFELICLQI